MTVWICGSVGPPVLVILILLPTAGRAFPLCCPTLHSTTTDMVSHCRMCMCTSDIQYTSLHLEGIVHELYLAANRISMLIISPGIIKT